MEGEVVTDPHRISLPEDLQAGSYAVDVGLYVPVTGDFLEVEGKRSLTLLESVTVEP